MHSTAPRHRHNLVLVAPGGGVEPRDAARLAALLGLRPLPLASAAQEPNQLLLALAAGPAGWLLPLGLDPGADLEGPGCWADVLAAWRQPALLLLPEDAAAGAPRAYHALLASGGVPLLGLVQLGGIWEPQRRRCDGLPWLGWLAAAAAADAPEADRALAAACQARWRLLSAARPDAPLTAPAAAGDRPA